MFRRKEAPKPPSPPVAENFIDRGVHLRADLRVEGSIAFHGTLVGNLRVGDVVYVGPGATIDGVVEAREARIEGKINGDLKAKEKVDLLPGSRLHGDVYTISLRIEEGAILRGTSFHGGDTWGEDD